ncbi:hypothetical protein GJV09_22415 [Enterobacteriaceae bacterium RIT702]|nr:hypothetical protein [Enterobacteriaceae bacterium RIT702]
MKLRNSYGQSIIPSDFIFLKLLLEFAMARYVDIHCKDFILMMLLIFFGSSISWAAKCDLKEGISTSLEHSGLCNFNVKSRSFEGTPAQQASCLTREVKRLGIIGNETISPFLKDLFGEAVPSISRVQFLLDSQQIKAEDVGGDLSTPISANYFIIHDTSAPNCSDKGSLASCKTRGEFPPDRDNANWNYNINYGGHPKKYTNRVAHVFTNRIGSSITEVNLAEHIATTKFESCVDVSAKVNLFVGVENIQPRLGDPKIPSPGKKVNDFDSPTPGFTNTQYERLALIYLVASSRRGQWMIPAFHAVLDQYYRDGHDDPQKFNMEEFSKAVQKYIKSLTSI